MNAERRACAGAVSGVCVLDGFSSISVLRCVRLLSPVGGIHGSCRAIKGGRFVPSKVYFARSRAAHGIGDRQRRATAAARRRMLHGIRAQPHAPGSRHRSHIG